MHKKSQVWIAIGERCTVYVNGLAVLAKPFTDADIPLDKDFQKVETIIEEFYCDRDDIFKELNERGYSNSGEETFVSSRVLIQPYKKLTKEQSQRIQERLERILKKSKKWLR